MYGMTAVFNPGKNSIYNFKDEQTFPTFFAKVFKYQLKNKSYLLEVVGNLKLVLGISHVRLDLRVGVVDDSQEHVDENEEDEEDKQHEEDWTQDAVGLLQLVEVKVTQDDAEQSEASFFFFLTKENDISFTMQKS